MRKSLLVPIVIFVSMVLFPQRLPAAGQTRFNPAWSAVLTGRRALAVVKQCSRNAPVGAKSSWTPSPTEIADLERGLEILLENQLGSDTQGPLHVGDYYRQYAGLILRGRRLIYVNGFHRQIIESDRDLHRRFPSIQVTDWTADPMAVCDGGKAFFGVEYDPTTKKFANFLFNGVA